MARPELLSIVIPCYRSATYIQRTVAELSEALGSWCPVEFVLVNDGSPDELQPVLERMAAEDSRVRFIELGANRGQHFATLQGFAKTGGDCVVTLDDDGQNPPGAARAVAEQLLSAGHDVVYGAFRTTSQSWFRKLASRVNRWMTKHTLGNQQGIALTNVRAIRGALARSVVSAGNSMPYIDALLWRSTRRISQVEVEHRSRNDGLSTYSLWKLIRLWVSHLTLLTIIPLQLASLGSLLVAVGAFLVGAVQLARVLAAREAPPGWLSLFLATTFLFGTLFVFLAIVSTYVGFIYVELNARSLNWVRSSSAAEVERPVKPPVK
jgi:polyisoprenyl-phosphate glycosyltransferase